MNPWDTQTQRLFPADGVVYTIQGNIIDRPDGARCNGSGWSSGKSIYTLNTIDRPAVAFVAGQGKNVTALDCRNFVGNNELSTTLQANGGHSLNGINPVVYDCRGNGDGETAATITGDHESRATDYSNVVCMGTAQAKAGIGQDVSGTLLHGHEHPIVAYKNPLRDRRYIVRRLTPLECCRLQGFPDGWGETDHKDSFTDEETAFWHGIRAAHAAVNGKAYKPCKREALLKWYNELHTDSAEYKMWGNGIALPCARYVMEGIADCEQRG